MQTDDFPDKLKKGCNSLDSCERLETEAKARVERCQENTIGYIRCSDARADLTVASGYATSWRETRELDEQARREREQKKEQDRLRADQEKREEAQQAGLFEAKRIQEENRLKRERIEAAEVKDAHERDLQYLKLLGPAGREQRVRTCVRDNGPGNCADLVMLIGEAIGDEKETAKLARISETPQQTRTSAHSSGDSEESSGGSMARCCDGTQSPSCACPGHQGCCSHHGGVCGCM